MTEGYPPQVQTVIDRFNRCRVAWNDSADPDGLALGEALHPSYFIEQPLSHRHAIVLAGYLTSESPSAARSWFYNNDSLLERSRHTLIMRAAIDRVLNLRKGKKA